MKRDMKDIDLQNAFWPMTEECHDKLLTALSGLREEKPVKRFTARTVLIAACIIVALMAVALAAGQILGWTDFYSDFYNTFVPDGAQQIMQNNGEVSYTVGPVKFTVSGLYCDGHIATASTNARLAEGVNALLTGSDPYDAIGANGENGEMIAQKLGVDPELSWVDAAKELDIPLYSVRAILEAPEEYSGEAMEDPMFNDDGSLTYFSMPLLNGKFDGEAMDFGLYLRVQEMNVEDPEQQPEALKEHMSISISLEKVTDTKEYTVPANMTVEDTVRLDSVRGDLFPGGLYLTASYTVLKEDLSEDDAIDVLYSLEYVQPNGDSFPTGMSLSGGVKDFDTWPVVETEDMISANQFPERIGLMMNGDEESIIVLELKK